MGDPAAPVVLCAVQDCPVAFDLPASIAKLQSLTAEAASRARQKAQQEWSTTIAEKAQILVVFPEAFLCAYPRGMDFGAVVGSRTDEGRAWFRKYHRSSVPVADVNGAEMSAILEAARSNGVTLVVGVIERCDATPSGPPRQGWGAPEKGGDGTLYCSVLTISPQGQLLSSRRKLGPTGSERLVWGQGSRSDIRVASTPVGRVASAICWENYMPLFRHALYQEGVDIWTAPTADSRDQWQSTMVHIALESRSFVVACNQFNARSDFPDDYPALQGLKASDTVTRGGSVIVSPLGKVLAGPLFDEPGFLMACVDDVKGQILESKMDFDPTGHYSRRDLLKLHINEDA
ncbi:unnamed protein product [Parajaminaea phylloscopi]